MVKNLSVTKKIIEIIKHDPQVTFVVAGIGNITGKSSGNSGRKSYRFRKEIILALETLADLR